jgi:hypothetical protein
MTFEGCGSLAACAQKSAFLRRSPHFGLAARLMRASKPPTLADNIVSVALNERSPGPPPRNARPSVWFPEAQFFVVHPRSGAAIGRRPVH